MKMSTNMLEKSSLLAKGTNKVEFTGFASSLFARLLAPDFRIALPKVMQKLAEQAALPENNGGHTNV
jgi:hypothetical protein